jgi:hypothetical protein
VFFVNFPKITVSPIPCKIAEKIEAKIPGTRKLNITLLVSTTPLEFIALLMLD